MTLGWLNPWMLIFLTGLPFLAARMRKLQRDKICLKAQWLGPRQGIGQENQRSPLFSVVAATGLMILALAGPIFSPGPVPFELRTRNLVWVIPSRPTPELKNRLQETFKQFFSPGQNGWRMALVTRGETTDLLCPLTRDLDFLTYTLEELGTSPTPEVENRKEFTAAWELALEQNASIMILLEATNNIEDLSWSDLIKQAMGKNIRVHLGAMSGNLPSSLIEEVASTKGKATELNGKLFTPGWFSSTVPTGAGVWREEFRILVFNPQPEWFLLATLVFLLLAYFPLNFSGRRAL